MTFNQLFTDTGARELRIGDGFRGNIRKVKIFEYPKNEIELSHSFRDYSKKILPRIF